MKKTQYKESKMLYQYNDETGEFVEIGIADTFIKPIDSRRHGFMITYLAEMICMIETLGNKKMKIVKYIIENMDKRTNMLIKTTREIAKDTGCSLMTVTETLKTLEEHGFIKRKTGIIMLNPKLMNNRRATGEALMLTEFVEFDSE